MYSRVSCCTNKRSIVGHGISTPRSFENLESEEHLMFFVLIFQDYSNLPKADIFALGLTMLLAAGAPPLPQNGDEWHSLREGKLPTLPQKLSSPFRALLQVNRLFYNAWIITLKWVKRMLLTDTVLLMFSRFRKLIPMMTPFSIYCMHF